MNKNKVRERQNHEKNTVKKEKNLSDNELSPFQTL